MSAPTGTKQWVKRDKHRDVKPADWASGDALKWSKGAASLYNPFIYNSDAVVEQAELDCVENGVCFKNTGRLRKYYKKLDHIVGTCSGEETPYIYAEWDTMVGIVHGRPISETLLKTIYKVRL